MTRQVSISVVVPAWNEEATIGACLISLEHQLDRDFEVVVVDNNCTDGTSRVAREHGARVVQCDRQGISSARNAGALEARGEVVCFVDADGEVDGRWMSRVRRRFATDPGLAALSGFTSFRSEAAAAGIVYDSYCVLLFALLATASLAGQPIVVGNNMAIRRDLFLQAGGFPACVAEDVRLARELRRRGGARTAFDSRMQIRYSSRRFVREGFLRTLLRWTRAVYRVEDEAAYGIDYARDPASPERTRTGDE